MKKNVFCAGMPLLSPWSRIAAIGSIAMLAACGDNVENVYQTGLEVFSSEKDLPKCSKDNEGDQAFVKDDAVTRICVDGDWVPMSGSMSADFSCKAVELKDKSGVKIVCNGDSIGVVLNGKDGEKGDAGEDGKDGDSGTGCSIADRTDSTVVVQCGDSTMTIDLGVALPNDTAEADSERTPISLDSLVGFTQKGPFLKGSTVYLYELSDGRTLKQTNGNFTSNITSDDGRYKFLARDLVSQYAMVVVDGYYRNEVTGKSSNAAIRLKALTDMRKRSSVNVNLLTHLEFERVYHLVTRGDASGKKMTVKQAKRQAQKEILKEFMIELKDETDAEDMDVFGSSEADAALLAISILLQGDRTESELMALLTEISTDMAEDGKWNASSKKVDSIKASLADWVAAMDSENKLEKFSDNVKGWGLSTTVPEFQKYVRNFYETTLGLGKCGEKDNVFGLITFIQNQNSGHYANSYWDRVNTGRFICKNDNRWYLASDLEKDTYGWNDTTVAAFKLGNITRSTYIFRKSGWFPFVDARDLFDGKSDTLNTGVRYTGEFYEFVDSVGGKAELRWPVEIGKDEWGRPSYQGIFAECDGICGEFELEKKDWETDLYPSVGFGFSVGEFTSDQVITTDVSSWEGLCVTYQLYSAEARVQLELVSFSDESFDTLYLSLPSTSKATVCSGWDGFKPVDEEASAISGNEAANSLAFLLFKFSGSTYESGNFKILGISKLSSAGQAESSSIVPSYGCGDLWCGYNFDYVVKTWLDDDSHGFWFDSTDVPEGGNSSITYPGSEAGSPLKTVTNEVINNCGGICGRVLIGDLAEYPYVYVGFSLSETGDSAKDISSWEGVCVLYKSDVSIGLEIGLTPEREEFVGYNVPVAIMRKSSDISVVDLPWSKFKGGVGWGNPIPPAEAAKEAVSMRFKMDGVIGSQGDFAIYSIGRLGTCTQ